MSEIIVVPTYKRDELLFLTLEAIRNQDALTPIIVSSDRDWESGDLKKTCKKFDAGLSFPEGNRGFGNSWNVITALALALISNHEIIHLIEDDTILYPGYLDWARRSLSGNRFAAVCGHVGNSLDTWYTSPCASWNADRLRQCLKLVPDRYLEAQTREEMQKTLDDAPGFKRSKFRYGSAEQDGFFLRCIEHFGWRTAFPEKPLCTHLGFFGYNRPTSDGPKGTFEQRIAACRAVYVNKHRRVELFGQRIVEMEMEGMSR